MNRDSGSREKSNGPQGNDPLQWLLVGAGPYATTPATGGWFVSVRMMAKVWDLRLPQSLKLLALALADWANDEGGNIYPKVATIAHKVGASERTVQRQLRTLEELGLLKIEHQGGGRNRTRRWRLELKGDKLAPFLPERVTPGTEKVTPDALKGDTAMSPDPSGTIKDPDDFSNEEPSFPRLPGESRKDWVRRFTAQMGRLDR